MNYHVYMVRCSNRSYYTGITNDLEKRIDQHNGVLQGGAKYTRMHRPVTLVYKEKHQDKSKALKREHVIKMLSHEEKAALCRRK